MDEFKTNKERIEIVEKIAEEWERNDVQYAVSHGLEKYPAELGRDLDVFFHKKDLKRAFQLTCKLLDKEHWIVINPNTPYNLTQLYAFKKGTHLQIDFFSKLYWLFIPLVETISTTYKIGPFNIDNWSYFAKAILIQILAGNIPRIYRRELIEDKKIQKKCEKIFGKSLSNELFTALVGNNEKQLLKIQSNLQKRLILYYVIIKPTSLVNIFNWLIVKIKRYFVSVAPIIALVGPDGVGKSHTLREIQKNGLFSTLWGDVTKHWRPGLLPDLGVLFGRKRTQGATSNAPRRNAGRGSSLRLAYYAFDFLFGDLLVNKVLSNKPKYILYDRCALDMVVDPVRYALASAKGPKLLWNILPKPDKVILLYDTPDRIVKRKAELSTEEIRRQLDIWCELFREGKVNSVVVVDADPSEIADRIDNIIFDAFTSKNGGKWTEKRNRGDDLNWILSILNANSSGAYSFITKDDYKIREKNGIVNCFGYLSFKDGRGYLIPLDSLPATINGLALYNPQNPKAIALKKMLRIALKVNQGRNIFFNNIVYLYNNEIPNRTPTILLFDYLKKVIGTEDISYAISLGTPSPDRKPVIQVSNNVGRTICYVKIGHNERTNNLVKNEANMLKYLRDKKLSFRVPIIKYRGEWDGRYYCIQLSPENQLLAAPRRLNEQYIKVIQDCYSLCSRSLQLQESEFWKRLIRKVETISNSYHRHLFWLGLSKVEKKLGDTIFPFHLCHGDLASWNAYILNDQLYIFDWEYAHFEGIPGYDLIHFVIQESKLVKNYTPHKVFNLFYANRTKFNGLLNQYFTTLKINLVYFESFILLYLLNKLIEEYDKELVNYQELNYYNSLLSLFIFADK